jgi:acyl-phosphate glycerol 3-phosphate acyltransferase
MQILFDAGLVLLGYLIGSIPFGLIIVKLKTGKDIRQVESGRTGGTNALRAAGFWAGLSTALMDIFKGTVAAWIALALTDNSLIHVLAPIAAVLGHNYSAYLPEFDETGKFKRLRGGAGGGPAAGGALGLWPEAGLIVILVGALVFFGAGLRFDDNHQRRGDGDRHLCGARLARLFPLGICAVWRAGDHHPAMGLTPQSEKTGRRHRTRGQHQPAWTH